MNEQMPPAVTGPVEPTVRRPLGMPDYTPDQKAAAFDALWETCGLGRGLLRDWVDRPVSRAAKEATFIRVPRYTFEILAEGEGMQRFRDVLHHLATRKGGPNQTAKRAPLGVRLSARLGQVADAKGLTNTQADAGGMGA